MEAPSTAFNRPLSEWLSAIDAGHIKLPSFQRDESWDRTRICSMLDTIVGNLPLGITLLLEVGDHEKFKSRPLETAPVKAQKPVEYLLDGQQRLTGLWRALPDNYEKTTYFVHDPALDDDPQNDDMELSVRWYARWTNKNKVRMPLWANEPRECLQRGIIPMRLLRPDNSAGMQAWLDAATEHLMPSTEKAEKLDGLEVRDLFRRYQDVKNKVRARILELRETVTHFNLPYLSMPARTTKPVALDVFINMNTNSKPLSTYDIIVAEVENVTGALLHERVAAIDLEYPAIARYGSVSDLLLQTGALLQDRSPNARGELEMDMADFVDGWSDAAHGLAIMVSLLEQQGIMDAQRLPSAVPLPVIAACYARAPLEGDAAGNVQSLMRRYLWSAFFTARYEYAAGSRALADYRALRRIVVEAGAGERQTELDSVPALDREEFPIATMDEMRAASWPNRKRTLARAILAASTRFGATDFADDQTITPENVTRREYHHLFPDKLLSDARIDSFRALNCAFITWKTNRVIGRMDPMGYLQERTERHDGDPEAVKQRLASHLVPFEVLASAGPYPSVEGEELRRRVEPDYEEFLRSRARLVHRAAELLCTGQSPSIEDVYASAISDDPEADVVSGNR